MRPEQRAMGPAQGGGRSVEEIAAAVGASVPSVYRLAKGKKR